MPEEADEKFTWLTSQNLKIRDKTNLDLLLLLEWRLLRRSPTSDDDDDDCRRPRLSRAMTNLIVENERDLVVFRPISIRLT